MMTVYSITINEDFSHHFIAQHDLKSTLKMAKEKTFLPEITFFLCSFGAKQIITMKIICIKSPSKLLSIKMN